MSAENLARPETADANTERRDLIVTAGGRQWQACGAQLVDGRPRFDWLELPGGSSPLPVDDLYVRSGRMVTPGGPKSAPVPMLIGLRRAIDEAVGAALRSEGGQ